MIYIKKTFQILVLLGFLWIAAYGAFSVSIISKSTKKPNGASDAIIVLTGGNHRIQTGFDLWAEGYAPQLFITGVHPSVSRGALIKEWHKNNENNLTLPACCFMIGQRATTTIQNAQETAEWIKGKPIKAITLVTSTYHTPRAVMEFKHAMPDIAITPSPVSKADYRPNEKRFWRITASEFHKIIFRKVTFLSYRIKRSLLSPIARKG